MRPLHLVPSGAEATAYPWWVIIDPRQMMRPDCHAVAQMITGPFFSRERAQRLLDDAPHRYSDRAVVFCMSGHASQDWRGVCGQPLAERAVPS